MGGGVNGVGGEESEVAGAMRGDAGSGADDMAAEYVGVGSSMSPVRADLNKVYYLRHHRSPKTWIATPRRSDFSLMKSKA